MNYLTGYTIKPYEITGLGGVIFTDGTNNAIQPNQQQCEAYGYTYDRASGTCSAFRYNTNLNRSFSNTTNRINGAGNTTELGANTIEINGANNRAAGLNNNCLINGSNNEIANGVNNATVLGSQGEALRDCEFVTSSSDAIGQYSIFFLSGATADGAATPLQLNGVEDANMIPRLTETLYSYTIDIIAYRTGGASGSGTVGDRIWFRLEGFVYNTFSDEVETRILARGYTTGMTVETTYPAGRMAVTVTGIAAMNWKWGATAKFYQMKVA
tara:strand:+ start:4502 stop:5311 length:810 start_codon:yes stop_codon:yes gene_type:complete